MIVTALEYVPLVSCVFICNCV